MKTKDIINQMREAINYFICHQDNQSDTEFCKNVDKLINLKSELANGAEKSEANLNIADVRHSFSCYVVFEILDCGVFSMALTAKKEKKKVHQFKTEAEAAQWIIENADDFRRYFIIKQISVH